MGLCEVIRAAAAAAVGFKEEQRFNFGRSANYPQWQLRAKKNFEIDTPYRLKSKKLVRPLILVYWGLISDMSSLNIELGQLANRFEMNKR